MNPSSSSQWLRKSIATSTRRRLVSVAVISLVALGATACSSSSSTPTTSSTSSSTPSSSTPTSSSSTPTTTANTQAELNRLANQLQSGQNATFVASYSITGSSFNGTGTMTLAHSGTNSLVGFSTSSGKFEEMGSGSTAVFCEATGSTWQCFKGSNLASLEVSLTDMVKNYSSSAMITALKADTSLATDVSQSSQTIAGQPSTCVSFTLTTTSGSATYCASSSGVMDEFEGHSATSSVKVILSSFSSSVPSSEFTPPATPTAFP